MVLGKLINLDYIMARAYCAGSRYGLGLFWSSFFSLVYNFSLLSSSLWETARYRLKYCLNRPLSPKQPINHGGSAQRCRTTMTSVVQEPGSSVG